MPAGVRQPGGSRPEVGILLPAMLAALLVAGIVFWSLLLPQAEKSVFGKAPLLDEIYYLDRAAELSGRGLCPAEPCFMSPLYPQLIRLAGSAGAVPADRVFTPDRLRGIRLLQIMCWLGTVLLLGWIGWRDLAPPEGTRTRRLLTASLPAVLFFLYRPAAAYTTAILVEMPLTFLVTAAVALLPGREPDDRPVLWRVFLTGLVLGLAGLLRGTALALVPMALWLVWRRGRASGGGGWIPLTLLVGAVVLVMAVPVIHNSRLAGHLRPPTLNSGVNLYIGNGPQANGFYVASIPGDWREDPAGRQYLAEQSGRPEVSLAQADSIWTARATRTMGRNPPRIVALWARKFWLQLQGWEIDQLIPLGAWSRQAVVARFLVVPYGLLVMLGLGYGLLMLMRHRRSPAAAWMLGLLLVMALQSVFFVVSRYRQVLVPLWVLLAAAALFEARLSPRNRVLLWIAGTLVVVPWGLRDVRAMWSAMAQANEAQRWAYVGIVEDSPADLQRADDLYRRALAGGAPGPVPWQGLLAVDRALHEEQSYREDLAAGLDSFPADLGLLKQKVSDLLQAGREDEAMPLLSQILAGHDRDADSLHNYAVLLAKRAELDQALGLASRLVSVHPDDPRGFLDLGIIQARLGRKEAARGTFERGLELHPGNAQLQHDLRRLGTGNAP